MPRRNEEIVWLLESISRLLALKGDSGFRVRAYDEAARTIGGMEEDIEDVHRAGRLTSIRGIGPSIAGKIAEYLDTGRLGYLEDLKQQVAPAAAELLDVPSIGPARARELYQSLGIASIAELEQAAREHLLAGLPGIGEKLEQRIAREAARVAQRTRRILLARALHAAGRVIGLLRDHPDIRAIDPAGSLRRMKETVGDIDILVASERPEPVMERFISIPPVQEVLSRGPTRSSVVTDDALQVDLRVIKPEQYGAALLYFTGSKEHNIALRQRAQRRSWKLSEYGLFDKSGRRIAGESEGEVYRALGMDWIPPELRENRGEIEAAQRHDLPVLVEEADVRGDLHLHTDWSDGHDSLERMLEAAIARGYQYIAVTDHSRGLAVARGLSVERVRQQSDAIRALNATHPEFRILHGAEVDIRRDGRLDYPDDLLEQLDIVTVSIHSGFDQPRREMTQRIIRALRHPSVDILNHPSGRLLGHRPEYEVDMEAVLQTAAASGVALEINGQPERLDLDDHWARRARELGIPLVLSSDAHSSAQLDGMRFAVATARRAWLRPQDVLNSLPVEQFIERLRHTARRKVGVA